MSEDALHHAAAAFLVAAQIRLLEERRADVADLLEVGGRHDEVLVDATANDLVGARLMIRAPPPHLPLATPSGTERDERERGAREASEMLGVVLALLRGYRSAPGQR